MSDSPTVHPLILVVGFSATIQKIIEVTFSREGITVTHYTDPAAMLGVELPAPPDVLFVDLDLLGRQSYKIVRQIRARPQFKQVKIIGISHHKGCFFRLTAWCAGIVYLTRPVPSREFIQVVMIHSRH